MMHRWKTMALASALAVLACGPAKAQTPPDAEAIASGNRDVASQAVPAPDYADPANWAAGPGGRGIAGNLPDGASPVAAEPKVDVFYVHPTTFKPKTPVWNQDPADPDSNRWTDESVVQRQASAWSGCCSIWSPRYRAASINALMSPTHRDPAFALAYSDVARAFDWFLANVSKGRPFIIAGHSQGAKHIGDLLEKKIAGTDLAKRMVAAYIVGINIAEGEVALRFKDVPVCATPDQTGCLVQWNSILAGTDLDPVVASYEKVFTQTYGDRPGKQTVCINPVTFDATKPHSLSSQAKGAVPGDPGFGAMKPLRAGRVAARCERGMLVVYPAPGLGLEPLPGGGVMHYHDIGLFWADIRANARLRTQAWLAAHGG